MPRLPCSALPPRPVTPLSATRSRSDGFCRKIVRNAQHRTISCSSKTESNLRVAPRYSPAPEGQQGPTSRPHAAHTDSCSNQQVGGRGRVQCNGEFGKILPQLSSIISQRQGQIPACITRHFLSDITRVTSKSFHAKLEMPCSMLASTCGERRDHKVTQAGRSHVACFDTNPLTSQTWPGESKALGLFAMRAGYFALISNTLR